ncbi:MAG: calpastatin [Acidimicrobiales bacterium]|nr:calpastatin [Acidimicrobiales bacterium]
MEQQADPFHLERFVAAQDPVFETVLAELLAARKRSHWMWFVFPQIAGLGTSSNAQYFAISGLDEAAAFLAHPVLGPRLIECTDLVIAHDAGTLETTLGWPDDMKFHSSMTLFSLVAADVSCFNDALVKHFSEGLDQQTVRVLAQLERHDPSSPID